jgi:sialic acid synthase SpsE
LHCVLSYPTKFEDANLNRIKYLIKKFPKYTIGYSDHTLPNSGMAITTTAYLLGAKIIEKHFTLDKNIKGNDHYHAMDCNDLKCLKENIKIIKKATSKFNPNYLNCEINSRKQARRSIIINTDLSKGDKIQKEHIICKRPGTGIEPKYIKKVIGKKMNKNINKDHILIWNDILFKK